ncbi:MAG: hypothetical protein AB1757_19010 [Acidobacteriota bacterium]
MSFWKKLTGDNFNLVDAAKSVFDSGKSLESSAHSVASNFVQQVATPKPAPAQMPQQPGLEMSGPEFAPIQGVSLELYANLLADMSDCGEDEARCLAIANSQGVSRDAWEAAKTGWTERMADPSLQNRVSLGFLKYYSPAMDKKRGGVEPVSLEDYTRIFAAMNYRKDPNDPAKQIDREIVLKENGLTLNQWNQCLVYWSPQVSDASNPALKRFQELLNNELKKYF